MSRVRSVLIVGGGFSGVMAAANLLRFSPHAVAVTIVEPSERLGEGPAYSTDDPAHLLNVPARKMGAWADDPEHFWKWVTQRLGATDPDAFLPRMLYAEYVRDVLREAAEACREGSSLEILRARVSDIIPETDRVRVCLEGGGEREADEVVLAIGLGPPRLPGGGCDGAEAEARVIRPWTRGWANAIAPEDRVLIVGTGLTMLDVLLSLANRGHRGGVDAVSVKGLLPMAHAPAAWSGQIGMPPVGEGLKALVRWFRGRVREGVPWRAAVDSMRPYTQQIWRGLSVRDQQRFLEKFVAYWDVHRHRCAPEVHARVEAMIASGALRVHAAMVVGLDCDRDGVLAVVRSEGSERTVAADRVVLCTGPEPDPRAWSPLIAGLVDRGELKPDALGIGLASDTDGCALDRAGGRTRLWLLGALRRGELWETTAAPELRVQAAELARRLVCGSVRSSAAE